MDTVAIPFLPTVLWLLAGALTIIALFLAVGLYAYYRSRLQAAVEDSGDAADLAAKKQQLRADVNALQEWIQVQKLELEKIMTERIEQDKLRGELSDLEKKCADRDQENQSLRNEVGELENQKHLVDQVVRQLREEEKLLQDRIDGAKEAEGRLVGMRSELEAVEKILKAAERQSEERLKAVTDLDIRIDSLRSEKNNLDRLIEDLADQANLSKDNASSLKEEESRVKEILERTGRDLELKARELHDLHERIQRLNTEINALGQQKIDLENIIGDLNEKKREALLLKKFKEKIAGENEEINRELAINRNELARLHVEVGEFREEYTRLKRENEKMGIMLSGSRTGDDQGERLAPFSDLVLTEPECLNINKFPNFQKDNRAESEYLLELKELLFQKHKLIFPSRVIDAFHASLKCHSINPLTVLAGVSGTGKTLLPVKYAEMMGMHLLVISVQPRWDSPQDMFGFYNYLEKKYKATELARALVRMDPYNFNDEPFDKLKWARPHDRMLLVLLDEMNLARTEYYFSEFLSKLELKRDVRNPEDESKRGNAQLELDTGPEKSLMFRLWFPDNVLFVGTMNEDETTQSLSDKVLDRANILRFGKPTGKLSTLPEDDVSNDLATRAFLSHERWKEWLHPYHPNAPWFAQVTKWLTLANDALNRVGRPFAYRLEKAAYTYVANYPDVETAGRHKLAFADQVEQKIIPKLRGVDLSEPPSRYCLDELGKIIDELGDKSLIEAFRVSREESQYLGMFRWRGVSRQTDE